MTRISKPRFISHHITGAVLADLAAALGVVALGVFLAVGGLEIELGAGYDRIGPRFFPYLVAIGLVSLGIWLGVAAIWGDWAKEGVEGNGGAGFPTNWSALGYLSLALVLNLLLLERAGFVMASSALFWLVARAFHSRRPLRDAAVAVLLSAVVFLVFTRGLGLNLPSGIFRSLF